jgi:hypothetical protein
MADCKRQFSQTHGTQTACFTLPPTEAGENERVGAFVTDPIRLVRLLAASSPFVAVGGDKGSSWVKLGVTYQHRQKQRFLPLLIFEGKDSYESLHELRTPNLTCFTDDSAHHAHIFSVLQHMIDSTEQSFLNGDWPFLSAILAHKGHSSFYPCPICIVERSFLLSEESYRLPTDGNSLHSSRTHTPFLTIPSERIVPTPLHLYLGISNRIIFNALAEMFTEQQVLASVKLVKSKHSAGCGGLSDLYALNGPEIRRFIKQKLATKLVVTEAVQARLRRNFLVRRDKMQEWLEKLHSYLLVSKKKKKVWDATELFKFRQFLEDIYKNWRQTTGDHPFPKLHMLRHAVDFAERHHLLGAASEAQIESFHFRFNNLYEVRHRNMSLNPKERVRRCLADSVLSLCPSTEIPEAARALLAIHAPQPQQAG